MNCVYCNEKIKNGNCKVFVKDTYYHNYHKTYRKKVYWHDACFELAEKRENEKRENDIEKLKKDIFKQTGIKV
jgi:hypothetical protein